MAVLPLKSKELLPYEVKHLMTKDSPIADMYPESAIIERDGKNADWQGTVLIPFVNTKRIIRAVNTTTLFSQERAKLYSQASNIILKRDPELAQIDRETQNMRSFLDRQKRFRGRGRGKQGYRGGYGGGRGRGGQGKTYQGRGGQGKTYQGRGYQKNPQYQRPKSETTRSINYPTTQVRKEQQKSEWQKRKTIL